jgi:hypothetical protein
MERSETGAEGDDMESLGPGDGGYGVDYEFEEADKGSLGFVGANKVKELKRDVRKAWEGKGQGHFALTPTARQTGVLWAYGVQVKLVDKEKGSMFFFICCAHDACVKMKDGKLSYKSEDDVDRHMPPKGFGAGVYEEEDDALHASGEHAVLRTFACARNVTAAEVTRALGCDPEVNHYTEDLQSDTSMEEATSD